MLAASVSASARAPSNDARRTNAERRASTRVDPLAVVGRHDPVTDGDVGADVADPADVRRDGRRRARVRTVLQPAIEARHPPRVGPGAPSRLPRLLEPRRPTRARELAVRLSDRHDDLVDEAPRQRRRGVDAGPAQRQRGGALAADAAGDARRAAGAGDQAEAELGQRDHGVGRGDDVVGRAPAPRSRRPCTTRAGARATCRRWGGRAGPGCA